MFPRSWEPSGTLDSGTRLAMALRRRPFSACNKRNRRRLHAGKRTYRFTFNYRVFAAQKRSTKETENVIERDVICPCLARTFNRSLFLKLANIYTLLERLKMILHKLVTIGLSSCEISARDYSHRLAFMIGTPQKQPVPQMAVFS